MKIKTTKKSVKEVANNIICIGYCSAHNLLYYQPKIYYTQRVEGWASDVFFINSSDYGVTAISTGYAPFGNIKPSRALIEKYENKARALAEKYPLKISHTALRSRTNKLLDDFICAAISENNNK